MAERSVRSGASRRRVATAAAPAHPALGAGPPGEPVTAGNRAAPSVGRANRGQLPRLLLVASRPRQWPKNVLVFAAPGAAGLLGHGAVLARTALVAVLFVVASAGVYLVNDVLDADSDRQHPTKCRRPVASGALPVGVAVAAGAGLLALACAGAAPVGGTVLVGVLATYVGISLSYSFFLKRQPVVELACVASGFVLRAAAGGAAVHVAISPWFLIVTSACAFLIVAGKRSAELAALGPHGDAHRAVLAAYPVVFLRSVRAVAASVALMSYALWAFERAAQLDGGHGGAGDIAFRLSVVPFVLVILLLELALEAGRGGAPEDLALSDRRLQVIGFAWVALVAVGIYT